MRFECYAHIPGIKAEEGLQVIAGEHCITVLPYNEWLCLEDPAMAYADRRYQKNQPVFLKSIIEVDPANRLEQVAAAVQAKFNPFVRCLADAFLLILSNPMLPDPMRSAFYYHIQASPDDKMCVGGEVIRQFGVNERELILSEDPGLIHITHEKMQSVARTFSNLVGIGAGDAMPEYAQVMNMIRLYGEPGVTILDLVVHFVAVHENVLNPNESRPLEKKFAQRAAFVFCEEFEQLRAMEDLCYQLYDLRSRALHSDETKPVIDKIHNMVGDELARLIMAMSFQTCSNLAALKSRNKTAEASIQALVKQIGKTTSGSRQAFAELKAWLQPEWLLSNESK